MDLSLSYLKYLRDVSRKLVLRGGFDRIFPGTSRAPDCLSLVSEKREPFWFRKANAEALKSDRQIFLGLGIVTGTSSITKSRKKKIAAPLFIIQTELDHEKAKVFLRRDTLTLNYDVVQHLVDFKIPSEEDEGELEPQQQREFERLLLLLDEVNENISKIALPEEITSQASNLDSGFFSATEELIVGLRKHNPRLGIEMLPASLSTRELLSRAKTIEPQFSPDGVLFAAKYPDQLSTYTALQQLINQLEAGGVSNPLIEQMVRSTLERGKFDYALDPINDEEIRQAIKLLPLTLSQRQKDAVYGAWRNPLSYVQGPPGTGKSHTIAAIMLTALFMGKKVLLVSQKKAAINVVKKKVFELSDHDDSVVFVSRDAEVKNILRQRLEDILQEATRDRDHRSLDAEKINNTNLRKKIDYKRDELSGLRKKISSMLDVQRAFFEANEEFLRLRDDTVDTFALKTGVLFKELPETIEKKWSNRLEKINFIRAKTGKSRLDVLYLKSTRRLAEKVLGADPRFLEIRNPKFELYLSRLTTCTKAYTNSVRAQSLTPDADDINTFRETYRRELNSLISLQKRFVSSTQRLRWREALEFRSQQENLGNFRSMLRNIDPNLIELRMKELDYSELTDALPIWAGLIRDLGSYLRFDSQLFDLVIVDESSQVNIAEVLPAFYRAKRVCVVGDKKQLGLNAAGLFSLNRQFEQMAWNRYFGQQYLLSDADQMGLIVSKHSILEFVTNPNSIQQPVSSTLNEHFRSAPKLAEYTSKTFYADEGGLKIMTMTGDKVTRPCFEACKVSASRSSEGRIVLEEVDKAMNIIEDLVQKETWKKDPIFMGRFTNGAVPSIGILSFTTDQNAEIKSRLDEQLDDNKRTLYDIFAGTTEEFQGNERNIMLILPASDELLTSAQFYNDARRMNVATSRAIDFSYLIYGGLPANFKFLDSYLRYFDVPKEDLGQPLRLIDRYFDWKFDEDKLASEFEWRVYEFLRGFIEDKFPKHGLSIFNQVQSCGKFLDFVVFNRSTSKAFAIEVDGQDHYQEDSLDYTSSHLDREALLSRAGWQILHIPYYKWYYHGWLGDAKTEAYERYLNRLRAELTKLIEHIS
jgi:hypothetical protein